jgi:hypothetical protein
MLAYNSKMEGGIFRLDFDLISDASISVFSAVVNYNPPK